MACNVITDPAISKRCDDLAKKRAKTRAQKKLMVTLKTHNHSPEDRPTIGILSNKLEINEGQLNQELDLTRLTIEQLEEGIIRKGCLGIASRCLKLSFQHSASSSHIIFHPL